MKIVMLAPMVALPILAAASPVGNGDFEMGTEGWSLPPGYAVVKGGGRNGTTALAYANSDPALPYAQPRQEVRLKPGEVYRFSAWMRTEDVTPKVGVGASVCIECQDEAGKTLKWNWTSGLKGTKGWTRIEGRTRPIPAKTKRCFVSVFCSPGSVGKAWFDDVEVAPYEPPPVGDMCSSRYRNVASAGRVDIGVAIAAPERFALGDLKASFSCAAVDGGKREMPVMLQRRDEASISIDVETLPMGMSEIGFAMHAPDGRELGRASMHFTRTASMPARKVCIDSHGRTLVDGKPFFPLGMFTGGRNRREEYVKGPFNCVMPYAMPDLETMDFFNTNGVMVIYSLKDVYFGTSRAPKNIRTAADERSVVEDRVRRFKEHPALLAWYLNDELPIALKGRLAARRDLLEELDPEHPTWIVVYQIENLREYMPTFDVIGTDPYPVPEHPLSMVTDWTRRTVAAFGGRRPVWQVPQAFDWGPAKKGRMPTAEEMRRMSWQCIAAGANGLVYYSFGAIAGRNVVTPFEKAWADVCAAAAEVRRYIPVMLSVESTPVVKGVPTDWGVRLWRKDGDVYMLAVNAQDTASSTVLELSEDFTNVTAEFGPPAERGGKGKVTVSLGGNEPAMYRMR